MQYRKLGNSGIEASIVGLGTYVTGHGDDKESIKGIQAALDLGVTLIDTAPVSYTHLTLPTIYSV